MTMTMIMSNILSSCLDLRYPKPEPDLEPGLLTITRPEVKKCYSSGPGGNNENGHNHLLHGKHDLVEE